MNAKHLWSKVMLLLISASLLMAACAPASPAAPAKDMTDPVTVVQTFYELYNADEIDKAMDLTAEEYVMNDPFGTYDREAAAVQWQAVRDAGLTFHQTNFAHTGDGRVTSCYEVFENGKSIDKGCGNVTHVHNGKIVFDGLEAAEQIWIVQQFYEILNTKDVDKAMSLTAEDYVMNDPFGTYDRTAAAAQWKVVVLEAGLSFNQTNFANTGNGRVTSCYEVIENGTSIDQGCGNVTHVRDGKIVYDGLETAEQIWVVQKYYEALNAEDLDLAMSFIAGEAVFINPTGTYEGAEAIRESLAGLNSDNITFDLSNFRNTDGRIVYDYQVMQGANLLDQGTNGLTIVEDGLIVFDGTEETLPGADVGSSDPAAIAQSFYQALNEGDLESLMALVADDVQCRGNCYLNGIQSFRSYMLGIVKGGDRIEISDLQVEGDQVTYVWEAYSHAGFFEARGIETLHIQDGKIVLMESVTQ